MSAIESLAPSFWILQITLAVSGVDGLLFGYDTGYISSVLISLGSDLGAPLTDGQKELVTSITSVGALVAAMLSGAIADRYGRLSVMWLSTLAFTIGALMQAFSTSLFVFVFGRLIVGLGVGAASMVAPMYIAEIAPAKYRGRLVVLDVLCITGGQVVAYIIGFLLDGVPFGWRYTVGFAAIPSTILFFVLPYLPESPRFLVQQFRYAEAHAVVWKTFPAATMDQVSQKVRDMANSMHSSSTGTLKFKEKVIQFRKPANFRSLVVACGLMSVQQLCGFNTLMYYSATIFQLAGFKHPKMVAVSVALTNFLFTCVSLKLIDTVGRRKILVWSMLGMPFGLATAAIGFSFLPANAAGEIVAGSSSGYATMVLVSMLVFVSSYATGLGNIPWQSTELFPNHLRALGTTAVTAFNWGPNIIVSATFLTLMKALSPSGAFLLYAVICLAGWAGVYYCYPDCAGLTLEQSHHIFEDGFGIGKADLMRKENEFWDGK